MLPNPSTVWLLLNFIAISLSISHLHHCWSSLLVSLFLPLPCSLFSIQKVACLKPKSDYAILLLITLSCLPVPLREKARMLATICTWSHSLLLLDSLLWSGLFAPSPAQPCPSLMFNLLSSSHKQADGFLLCLEHCPEYF